MMSWARAFELRQRLKGSLWALPLLGCGVGIVLAEGALALDSAVDVSSWLQYSAATASSVLAAIIGAMISLLGFVVTVTVLVVQQATGTLSPRYMRLWYRDRLQKVVLATFVGTFTYSFSLLRRVGDSGPVPSLGVTFAGLATVVSMVLLLFYVNKFTHNLRPVAVAAAVATAGQRVLTTGGHQLARSGGAHDQGRRWAEEPRSTVLTGRAGSIQAVALARLVAEARRCDCVLVFRHGIGDFLPEGAPLIDVYGSTVPSGRRISGYVATGIERTIEQDPAFALRILVDIAIRALSPAVNDPTTADQVLGYIEQLLHCLGRSTLAPHWAVRDADGAVRVVLPGRSWEEFLVLAVTEIRLCGATSPQVCRRLRSVLDGLLVHVPAERRAAVSAELRRLDAAVERNFPDPEMRAFARQGDRQGIGGHSDEPAPWSAGPWADADAAAAGGR